jgi:putative transport protein
VRAVGHEAEINTFAQMVGIREQRIHETGIPTFAFGLVIGLLLGMIPLPLPGDTEVTLGLAGGPLFVGLLLGHFGRIGKLRVHVPAAGRYLMRELGLVLFLVYAGTSAGATLVETVQTHGLSLAILALLTVSYGLVVGFVMSYVAFKQSSASTVGLTCGAMTSTPGLGAAAAQFDSDAPALAYATVYPLALVTMTVTAQLLVSVLKTFGG